MAEKRLTTDELRVLLDQANTRVVDVRPVDAYNGWKMRDEQRGGHIRGARSLPLKWTRYIDWPDIVKGKELHPSHTLVVYGYNVMETDLALRHFVRAGFENVNAYDGFVGQWGANPELPMDRLSRYRNLVSPQWLDTLLKSGSAPECENNRFVVCHAHYQNRGAYDEGHIPGAVELDTNELESPETWNRRNPEELKEAFEKSGITYDTTVILYGRFSFPDNDDPFPGSSAGHLGAIRAAFIMLYAGVQDVRILNGGLQSWVDAGFSLSNENTPKKPVVDFGTPIPQHPEWVVDTPQAKEILKQSDANLVSVRSWREFIGEVSGYHYIQKKGRIPGAVFGNCGSDAYHMENYRNADHTTREYHEIESIWRTAGITSDQHNAFYCGTGWRGSEAFFNAWLMGWPRISVYDGGWFEWSNDENNPYETGIPQ